MGGNFSFKRSKGPRNLIGIALKLNNLNDHLLFTTRRSDFVNLQNILNPVITKLKSQELSLIGLQIPARHIDEVFSIMGLHLDFIFAHNVVSNNSFFSPEGLDLIQAIGDTGQAALLNIVTQAVRRMLP